MNAIAHRCIFCNVRLTGESDSSAGGMLDRLGFSRCDVAEDHFHMCHCTDCHCGGECAEHAA